MPINKTNDNEFENRNLKFKNSSIYPTDDDTIVHSLRLHKKRKLAMDNYFKQQGLNLNTGIRQVLYTWMDQNEIKPPKEQN